MNYIYLVIFLALGALCSVGHASEALQSIKVTDKKKAYLIQIDLIEEQVTEEPNIAEQKLKSLLDETKSNQIVDNIILLKIYQNLCVVNQVLGNYDAMIAYANEGLAHTKDTVITESLGYLLACKGVYLAHSGEQSESFKIFKTAITTAKSHGFNELLAFLYQLRSYSSIKLGDYESSLSDLMLAKELLNRLGKDDEYYGAISNIAMVLSKIGDLERSEKFYREAIDYFKNKSNQYVLARMKGNLGNVLIARKRFIEAINTIEEAILINEKLKNNRALVNHYISLFDLAIKLNDHDIAFEYLATSKKHARYVDDKILSKLVDLNYLRFFLMTDQLTKARKIGRELLKNLPDGWNHKLRSELYMMLYKVEKESGTVELALHYHEQYFRYSQQELADRTTDTINKLRLNFERAALEDKIDLLENENQLNSKIIAANQRETKLFTTIGILAFMIVAILSYVLVKSLNNSARLKRLADTDSLTKLKNRRFMMRSLKELVREGKVVEESAVIAIIDIDDFKEVNDTYGHPIGDVVLQKIAILLKRELRKEDLIGRVGGEEFLVIFSDTCEQTAYEILSRVQSKINSESQSSAWVNRKHPISVSIGVHKCLTQETLKDIYNIADSALYQAKRSGKNRIESL